MNDEISLDFEKIISRAKSFIIRKGVTDEEAEDFAQNCAIKAFEINGPVNYEYMYLNYRDHERADKRILSGPQGSLTGFRTISLATPIDSSDKDSAGLGDFIADSRDELGDREEAFGITRVIESILNLAKSKKTRQWATRTYYDWLGENAF